MAKLFNEKERDLIFAVRNFRASKGRMQQKDQLEGYIYKLLTDLMEN